MSAPGPDPIEQPPVDACPRCGAALQPGQDWCLNCGMAVTTHVAGAPGWRTPVAIVGVVLALAAAALVVAFLELSDDAEREVAQAPPATATPGAATSPTPSPGGPTGTTGSAGPSGPTGTTGPTGSDGRPSPTPFPTSSPGTGTIGSWPAGRTAHTVVLASETSRAAAEAKARRFQSSGRSIGILDSDEFEGLRGGYHVVFSGQYDTREAADSAAQSLKSTVPDAYVRRIDPK